MYWFPAYLRQTYFEFWDILEFRAAATFWYDEVNFVVWYVSENVLRSTYTISIRWCLFNRKVKYKMLDTENLWNIYKLYIQRVIFSNEVIINYYKPRRGYLVANFFRGNTSAAAVCFDT